MSEDEKLARILKCCESYLGIKEEPAGSNNVIFNTWFYGHEVQDGIDLHGNKDPRASWAWCGTSASKGYADGGFPLGTIDYLKGFAGIPYAIDNLHKWGKEVSAQESKPGYIVFYKFRNRAGVWVWAHVGTLATTVTTTFRAYEGNTGIGNDSNGGEYMLRQRNYDVPDHFKFVRPNCLDNEPKNINA